MRNAIVSLVLGLVGGGLGAFLVTQAQGEKAGPPASQPAAAREASDLVARIERLEALAPLRGEDGASLQGRATGVTAAEVEALVPTLEDSLLERIQPRVEEVVTAKWEALKESSSEQDEAGSRRGGRRRLPLAEVAAEIGISAGDEDELRRIYKDSEERMIQLMAGEDGDVEQVRRDIELATNDESLRPQMMAKYVPKFMKNVGEIMSIEADKQTRIQETLGPEKAAEYQRYDVVEGRPFGLGGSMRVEARAGR